jgi:putative ABC transport system permease protein
MKHALRQLAMNPGFAVVALLTLALGIGVNTTAFTVLNRLMLQSLPFHDPKTLVQVWSNTVRDGNVLVPLADYFDEQAQNTVFTDMAAYSPWNSLSYAEAGKAPIQVGAIYMTANFFPILGVRPQLGRTPTEEEAKKSAFVTLISDSFWRQHYGADPAVLGRTIRLNSRESTIIGVMPPSLEDPALFNSRPVIYYLDPATHSRTVRTVGWELVLARLKPGVKIEQAQEQMNVIAKRLAHDYPETNKDRGAKVLPYPTNQLGDEGAQLTWMTLALTGLVLLIACINLANLQLVRTTRRSQEIAIRLSLGCPRRRLIGMFLLESVIISTIGGALGIGVSIWSNAFVARFLAMDLPLNLRVIAFTFLVSLVTGALFGAVPAWMATRVDIGRSLKSGGRGSTSDRSRHWLRQSLVVIELALALTLLAGAGFIVSGIYRLTHRDLGWDATHEVFAAINLDQDHFSGKENLPRVLAFGDHTLESLRAIPGVEAATISSGSPSWGGRTEPFRVEGQAPPEKGQEQQAGFFSVSPGWFKVFGMHLIQGREFTEADRADSAQVAIVSESMARKLWPSESPLGKRIASVNLGDPKAALKWAEVVGVMRDFKGGSEFYNPAMSSLRFIRPWTQDEENNRGFVACVRTAGPPAPLKETVRKTMGLLAPDLALNYLATIDEDTAQTYSFFNFLRRILVQIAILGLLLSAVGIYGVVANLASERTKEIGIRLALGAQPAGIIWLFVRNGLVLAGAGAALGLGAAFILVTMLGRLLPALPGKDPRVVLASALLLVGVALAACWLPARRTTKISPTVALRAE